MATDVFSDRNDVWTLIPFLKTMDEKLGFRYPSVTADSGYESEEGYTYLRETRQTPYIKPQTYEKWKRRSFKQDISKRENMAYDAETDVYICYAQKKLSPVFVKKQKARVAMNQKLPSMNVKIAKTVLTKKKCTRAKGNKAIICFQKLLGKTTRVL